MKSLPQIEALYEETDQIFDTQRQDALTSGDEAAARRIEQRQLLNDQAYFVLCWGQLETAIDDACSAAIRCRTRTGRCVGPSTSIIRTIRDFLDCSSISVSRSSSAPGRPYAKVMLYYEMRNKIAHVKLEAKRIDVAQIIADFYVIQDDLKP